MASTKTRFRFAPSPNGELHLGHAYSALMTWEIAAKHGGEVLLRIEDIDTSRTREHFVEGIFTDLDWLGLTWSQPVRRQSEHFDDYHAAIEVLQSKGVLYPCTATRKQIAAAVAGLDKWPSDPDGVPHYPGLMHVATDNVANSDISRAVPGNGVALRIDMDLALAMSTENDPLEFKSFKCGGRMRNHSCDPSVWGDAVIVRKDTPTSYHLSVVVDDALQGITHVTRGRDLEAATSLHVLLQRCLGLPSPVYHHHDLITDSKGRKLSKSVRDTSLRQLREAGWSPEDVRHAVGLGRQS